MGGTQIFSKAYERAKDGRAEALRLLAAHHVLSCFSISIPPLGRAICDGSARNGAVSRAINGMHVHAAPGKAVGDAVVMTCGICDQCWLQKVSAVLSRAGLSRELGPHLDAMVSRARSVHSKQNIGYSINIFFAAYFFLHAELR